MPKLIICDMDGVILDSMGFLRELGIRTIQNGYNISRNAAMEVYESTVGMPFHAQLDSAFPDDPENRFASTKYHNIHMEMAPYLPLGKGLTPELIQSLKPVTSLVTSTTKTILKKSPRVQELGFALKSGYPPTKKIQILDAMRCLRDIKSCDVLYLGDSPYDRMLADEIGIQFWKIDNPNETANYLSAWTEVHISG